MSKTTNTYRFDQPKINTLGSPVLDIIKFIDYIEKCRASEIQMDLRSLKFLQPAFILPIAALSDFLMGSGTPVMHNKPSHESCSSYLSTVNFPLGIRPDELISWEISLKKYEHKSYLPIINFPTDRSEKNTTIREKLLSQMSLLIKNRLKLTGDYENAVNYLLSEITDNIIEHSAIDRGWLMVQYYPTTFYLDICIIDTGRTILGSYRDSGFIDITTSAAAIGKAMEGLSTKSSERGTGIRTSKTMSIDGLQGDFMLFSGNALYYNNKVVTLNVSWPGTFVAMRIKNGVDSFSIYNFV